MPTIEVNYEDLLSLVGKHIPLDELREKAILYAKGEIEAVDGVNLKIDIKDTNRPDLWSAEGIAREIAGRYGKPGLPEYRVGKSNIVVNVDPKVNKIRPLIVCAVVRNLKINDDILSQMIQLQEKISLTFGRNRKEVAIGVYDMRRIKPPVKYTTVKPNGIKFVPLEFKQKMTPREILKKHPKGKEFRHLLEGCPEYPILIDSAGEVLSLPPIINSNYTGKVTRKTRDVFVECTGFDFRFLVPALNAIVSPLADRGGRLESVENIYPGKKMVTPDLRPKKTRVHIDYMNRLSGLNLKIRDVCRLLEKARYKAKPKGKVVDLLYPAYRQDIMHERDVVEDVLISYGYDKIEPIVPRLATIGKQSEIEAFSESAADMMIGLGNQEILSYTLTSKKNLFDRMNLPESPVVEIENIISSNWCVFRNSLLPGVLEFLSRNKNREYPQRIFEIGDIILLDEREETKTRDVRKLAFVLSNTTIGYEEVSSMLDALLSNLGLKYSLKQSNHPSFIKGRAASIIVSGKEIGVIGEIHPLVLSRWNLEKPVAGFELNLQQIFEKLKK